MSQYKTIKPSVFELDARYSTTRRVTKIQPFIANSPGDKIKSALFLPKNSKRKAEVGLRSQGYFKLNNCDFPLISVVTVVFNDVKHLERTVNSIINQDYNNVEYIIIDGGSSDGTLDIIKKYEDKIDYWVSEPDDGIYDAMNKAVSVANGKWINFMNSGDKFYDNYIISSIFPTNAADLIYGDHEIRYKTINKPVKAKSILEIYKGMIFCHQSMFISRDLQISHPYQHYKYKIAADYKLIFDYITSNRHNVFYTNSVIATVESKGVSNKNIFKTIKEYKTITLSKTGFFRIRLYYYFRYFDAFIRMTIKLMLPEVAIDFVRKKI